MDDFEYDAFLSDMLNTDFADPSPDTVQSAPPTVPTEFDMSVPAAMPPTVPMAMPTGFTPIQSPFYPYAIHGSPFVQDIPFMQFGKSASATSSHMQGSDNVNASDLCKALDEVISRYPNVPLARFKKEAGNAWRRKHPDANIPMREFQTFVKANIKRVRGANPDASHAEHMRAIGSMWRETKEASTSDIASSRIVGNKRKHV